MATDDDVIRLRDIGLNYPLDAAWRSTQRYILSSYVALPDEGGIFDQDAQLMDDMHTLVARYNFHVQKLTGGATDADADGEPTHEIDIYN